MISGFQAASICHSAKTAERESVQLNAVSLEKP